MLKALRSKQEAGDLLSTYLLQGWIMTDEICKVDACSFPLMKSKDGSLSFCTQHDTLPNAGAAHNYQSKPVTKEAEQEALPKPKQPEPVFNLVDNGDEELRIRRERREQSSKASQLIGQKMLQRWALLNEHCPNESCYAVPLVRNPDTKQMYCVICENIILTEEEASKLPKQQPKEQPKEQPKTQSTESESKPVHSPIVSPVQEERKRQKVGQPAHVQLSDEAASFSPNFVVSTLSSKMNELAEKVKTCHDPVELAKLFQSIKRCAGAIQACVEAGEVCDRVSH